MYYYKLSKSAFSLLVFVISICHINISFARQNNTHMQAQSIQPHQVGQDHSGEKIHSEGKDLAKQTEDVVKQTENIEYKNMKYFKIIAKTTVDMLIASRNVIAMNQELINR